MGKSILTAVLAVAGLLSKGFIGPCDVRYRLTKYLFEGAVTTAVFVDSPCDVMLYNLGMTETYGHICLPLGVAAALSAPTAMYTKNGDSVMNKLPKTCVCYDDDGLRIVQNPTKEDI